MNRCAVCGGELTRSNVNSHYDANMCLNCECHLHHQAQGYIPVSERSRPPSPVSQFVVDNRVRPYRETRLWRSKEERGSANRVNNEHKKNNYRELRANGCPPSVAAKNISSKRAKVLLKQLKNKEGGNNS